MEKVPVNPADSADLQPLSKACMLELGTECLHVEQVNVSQG
jgi:hypothetical protein